MQRIRIALILILACTSIATAQTPATPSELPTAQLQKKVEAHVRNLFALGTTFQVKAATPKESMLAGLLEVNVEVSMEGGSDTLTLYVSKDGRYMVRGDVFDNTKDYFAENRAQMNLTAAPSKGPANARVVVVEYGDFQCPTCRALYSIMKEVQPQFPQVRFVFKDFPLEQIHPWAASAASAGRCAYQQKPASFWVLHDRIYEDQEIISATTVWQKMQDYATDAGLDVDAFRTCMAAPETKAAIKKSVDEGIKLKVANTPTMFVNGRRIVGADRQSLEQFIRYELAATAPAPATPKP